MAVAKKAPVPKTTAAQKKIAYKANVDPNKMTPKNYDILYNKKKAAPVVAKAAPTPTRTIPKTKPIPAPGNTRQIPEGPRPKPPGRQIPEGPRPIPAPPRGVPRTAPKPPIRTTPPVKPINDFPTNPRRPAPTRPGPGEGMVLDKTAKPIDPSKIRTNKKV